MLSKVSTHSFVESNRARLQCAMCVNKKCLPHFFPLWDERCLSRKHVFLWINYCKLPFEKEGTCTPKGYLQPLKCWKRFLLSSRLHHENNATVQDFMRSNIAPVWIMALTCFLKACCPTLLPSTIPQMPHLWDEQWPLKETNQQKGNLPIERNAFLLPRDTAAFE